ncbi:hypothetical protein C8T65DRAFT_579678 [Cerioporus squamosus]|nr:hypothetical protein C8T65DRAFT_579678 [Cerioporus squamosus]
MQPLGQDGTRRPRKRGPPEESADNSDRAKHHKSSSDALSSATTAPSDAPTPATPAPSTPSVRTVRDLYEEIIRVRYPGYKPKNDFELFALGGSDYSYVEEGGLEAHLAEEWSDMVAQLGGPDLVMVEVCSSLDAVAEVTGEKPLPGAPDVKIIPIPGSPYALRLWPGAISEREFCVDYVLADDTSKSVNKPPGYELTLHVPTPLPWLGIGGQALDSLETNFGIQEDDILQGEEKFVVLDGMICTLEYPEQGAGGAVRFEVPVRAIE